MYAELVIKKGEYLGFCPMKGYMYSLKVTENEYKIIAILNGDDTTLIEYTVHH